MKASFSFIQVLLLCIFGTGFHSCENPMLKNPVDGIWVIDTLIYKGINYKPALDVNAISFDKNGESCRVPLLLEKGYYADELTNDRFGNYELTQHSDKGYTLKIYSVTTVFSGTHTLSFADDTKRKALVAELRSMDLYMVMSRLLLDYDKNRHVIRRISNEKR